MAKLFASVLLLAASAWAADITITVRNNLGAVVSTTVINTDDKVIKALNDWRMAQILAPAIPEHKDAQGKTIPAVPAVLLYPTISDFWKTKLKDIILPVLQDYHDAIIAQRAKIDAANAAIKALQDGAVQ